MKTIGLLGGMSWESSAVYYSMINALVREKLGGSHSAKIAMLSFDFQEIEELQYEGRWDELRAKLKDASKRLKTAGADCIVLCTNTMHKVADSIERESGIPLLHIARCVGKKIAGSGLRTVGLLGTIFTMEQDFYRSILETEFGLAVLIPDAPDRKIVNSIIYDELVKGVVTDASRTEYRRIMDGLASRGAEGIILGCTEIGLLIDSYALPLFDSTIIHSEEAVRFCLG